jgi:hypothetical protein
MRNTTAPIALRFIQETCGLPGRYETQQPQSTDMIRLPRVPAFKTNNAFVLDFYAVASVAASARLSKRCHRAHNLQQLVNAAGLSQTEVNSSVPLGVPARQVGRTSYGAIIEENEKCRIS